MFHIRLFLLCCVLSFATDTALAVPVCSSEPAVPSCARFSSRFHSHQEFEACRRKLDKYIEDANEYALCISHRQQDRIREAVRKFNKRTPHRR
ncbi:MAG: hypothetical protein PUB69_03810 [Desulfovibrionaceae bacterium]|nr:hypothetical protein [Desulfovibrionaceae bacterium]